MQEKASAPPIRFAGFTDNWERRRTADLAEYSKGTGYSKGDLTEDGTPIILYGRLYTKYQFVIDDIDTFAVAKTGSVFSKGGEILIPASGETAEDIARAAVVAKSGVLLGGDLNILRPVEQVNPVFLAIAISNGKPQEELAKKAQGKSVVHIHNSDIQEITVSFPTRAEQERIVGLFLYFDHLIDLYQRKYSLLCNIKTSMLDKMFPKEGTAVPEIRFAGFSGDWEQRKLGEILEEYNEQCEKGGAFEHVSLTKEGVVPKTKRYDRDALVQHEDKKYRITNLNDICYNPANLKFGVICRNTFGPGIFSPIYVTFHVSENDDPACIEHLVKRSCFIDEALRNQEGTVYERMAVKPADLLAMDVFIPSKQEQQLIGGFLSTLDRLITLHQRELERLQKIKKACLEKMFV